MTDPRYGTDALDGTSYAFGAKLPYTHMNNYVAWLRALDIGVEKELLFNWPYSNTYVATDITLDTTLNRYVVSSDSGGNPTAQWSNDFNTWYAAGSLPASSGLTNNYCAADGSGNFVMGGTPGSSSVNKFRYSSNGDVWAVGTVATASTAGVSCVSWVNFLSKFVAGQSGGTLTILDSSNGASWAETTPALTFTPAVIADDGTNLVVCGKTAQTQLLSGTSIAGLAARNLPSSAAWEGLAYCPNQATWLTISNAANVAKSVNGGTTWSSVTATWPDATPAFGLNCLTATENYFIAVGAVTVGGTAARVIMASDDAGATWSNIGVSSNTATLIKYVGGQIVGKNSADVFASIRIPV